MRPVQLKENTNSMSNLGMGTPESTEISLFVRTSDEEIKGWDKQSIHDAPVHGTNISEYAASMVSREIEKLILSLDLHYVTAPHGQDNSSYSCNSTNIEGINSVTDFFSKVSSWNKGKVDELNDRRRVRIN